MTLPGACGQDEVQFKVKTQKAHAGPVTPQPGLAAIVFLQQLQGSFGVAPTTRFAVDGSWVGADKGVSYFVVPLPPGQHHLCAVRQSGIRSDKVEPGLLNLTAKAGETYFYVFTITRTEVSPLALSGGGGTPGDPGNQNMTSKSSDTVDSSALVALDESAAQSRMQSAPLSSFVVK